MSNQTAEKVYEYDNYRFFLRDFFHEQKQLKAVFSHRYFARRAGFSSSSFCAHVIDGKRNLTAESLRKMSRGLGLSGKAAAYFEALVYYNQAKTVDDREHYFRVLERLRKSTQFYKVHQRQFAYYDEWYYPVIRELAVYGSWNGDYAALGRLVKPAIPPEKARKAFETLLAVGLLERDANGRLRQSAEAVTAQDVPWHVTRKTRKELVTKAIEAMETLPIDKRHIAGVTVALSEQMFGQVVQRLDELRKEILAAATDDTEVNGVYQVNFQAFPMSERLSWKAPQQEGDRHESA
jgi:uncharacterized protein (TIGR02147 family)